MALSTTVIVAEEGTVTLATHSRGTWGEGTGQRDELIRLGHEKKIFCRRKSRIMVVGVY